jgi:hypothetical protein
MKTLRLLLVSAMACAGMAACSDDDNDSTGINDSDVTGTYNLTAIIVPSAVDYNEDGTVSNNLLDESSCYTGSNIVLNDDHTFTSTYSSVFFESETGCHTEEASGTWSLDGDQLSLNNTIMEPANTVEYTVSGSTLILSEENTPYPDRDVDGNPMYSTGTVHINYTKIE